MLDARCTPLHAGKNDVAEVIENNVVARDGIEPPTPAFSGLDSSRAIAFKTHDKSSLNAPKTAYLLGQEWDKILAGQNCLPIAAQLRHATSTIAGLNALPM